MGNICPCFKKTNKIAINEPLLDYTTNNITNNNDEYSETRLSKGIGFEFNSSKVDNDTILLNTTINSINNNDSILTNNFENS